MTLSDMLIGCLIMALVTYVTKAVGLLLVRKQITNPNTTPEQISSGKITHLQIILFCSIDHNRRGSDNKTGHNPANFILKGSNFRMIAQNSQPYSQI